MVYVCEPFDYTKSGSSGFSQVYPMRRVRSTDARFSRACDSHLPPPHAERSEGRLEQRARPTPFPAEADENARTVEVNHAGRKSQCRKRAESQTLRRLQAREPDRLPSRARRAKDSKRYRGVDPV